jgi:hypothetical protein
LTCTKKMYIFFVNLTIFFLTWGRIGFDGGMEA